MRTKIILAIALMASAIIGQAQSYCNRLNTMPLNIKIQADNSTKVLADITYYQAEGTPLEKFSHAYDKLGRKQYKLCQKWNKQDGEWQNEYREDSHYNTNQISVVSAMWKNGGWMNMDKMDLVKDTDGGKMSAFSYRWDVGAGNWQSAANKEEAWTYDAQGRVSVYTEKIGTNTFQVLYTYNEMGEMAEELLQLYHVASAAWKNIGKYEYTKISKDQTVAKSYASQGDNWIYAGKMVFMYDMFGNMARCEQYDRNNQMTTYCLLTYSNVDDEIMTVKEDTTVKAYPNPATNSFELILSETFVNHPAIIYDTIGRQVKNFVVSGTRTRVDVSDLTSGVYVIKVGNYSGKLFIR